MENYYSPPTESLSMTKHFMVIYHNSIKNSILLQYYAHQSIQVPTSPPQKNFSAKAQPLGQQTSTTGSTLEDLVSLSCNQHRNIGILWKSNLKRLSNHSLVIPSCFSLSAIPESFEVFHQL